MKSAFIIGSNGPESAAPLHYARLDAQALARTLERPEIGYKVIQPEFTDDAHEIRRKLIDVAETAAESDTLLFYFSGHGVLEKGELYLLLESSDFGKLFSSSLSITDFIRIIQFCPAKSKLLILDCCHAGAATSMLGIRSAVGLSLEELGVPREQFLILMASGRLERAREIDELQSGFFTHSLVEALWQMPLSDKDNDGALSVQDALFYIASKASIHNSVSKDRQVPIPQLFGQQKGEYYLIDNPLWNWPVSEIQWIEGHTMVPLPVKPVSTCGNGQYAVCLSKYPVTNEQYHRFLLATKRSVPTGKQFVNKRWKGPFCPMTDSLYNQPKQPVVCVNYEDAINYCKWLNSYDEDKRLGGIARLPTSDLWDYAAHGSRYNTSDPGHWLSQTAQVHHKAPSPAIIETDGSRTNKRGISDMFGNVWEWCAMEYEHRGITISVCWSYRLRQREEQDPLETIQLRGGSFLDDMTRYHRPEVETSSLEDKSRTRHTDLGFRIGCSIRMEALPNDIRNILEKDYLPHVKATGHDVDMYE